VTLGPVQLSALGFTAPYPRVGEAAAWRTWGRGGHRRGLRSRPLVDLTVLC
jgi:hypothetical protein